MPPAVHPSTWAARLALSLAPALDAVRLIPGLEALLLGSWVWVRGPALPESHEALMARIPWFNRFEVRESNWLFEQGHALPGGRLPEGSWRPLPEWLVPVAPAAALPGDLRSRAVLEMQRSSQEQPPALLQIPLGVWHDYAVSAPSVRLARLVYVQDEISGSVLVRGTPLPPLTGKRYYLHGPAAIPCGFTPSPLLQPPTLVTWLGLKEDELALFDEEGTYARISGDQWRLADRSVIRLNGRTTAQA